MRADGVVVNLSMRPLLECKREYLAGVLCECPVRGQVRPIGAGAAGVDFLRACPGPEASVSVLIDNGHKLSRQLMAMEGHG